MLENAIIWIYAAAVAQAIFLGFALATIQIKNRAAAAFLSAIMLVMAATLIEQFADMIGASLELALGLAIEFALAPLFYFFVRSIVSPAEIHPLTAEKAWRMSRHFFPFGAAIILLAVFHAANNGGNLGIAHPQFGRAITIMVFIKLGYFAGYAWAAERVMRRAAESAKSFRAVHLRWIHRWLLTVFAAIAASYAIFVLYLAGVPIWRDSDVYAGLFVSFVIFSIAYFALANRKALDYLPQRAAAPSDADQRNAATIKSYLERERPYLEPDFTLEAVCAATDLSQVAVTAAVSAMSGAGFQEYVNRLRVAAFKNLAAAPSNRSKTTLELAFAAGFNSKATFYRAFRAETGHEPKKFRESLKIA